MNKLFKNSISAFIITALFGFVLVYFLSGVTGFDRLTWSFTIALIFGISNIGFLLLLYFGGIYESLLKDLKLIIIEIIILYVIYFGIGIVINYLPASFKYEIVYEQDTLKFFLKPPFDFIYSYVIVAVIMLLYKRFSKKEE